MLIEIKKVISDFEMFGFSHFKKEWISYHAYEGKRGVLADPEKVILLQVCTNYLDQNKCYEYSENTTWKNAWGTNPGRIPVVMSSESQIEAYSKLIYTIDMLYGDKEGTLNVRFVQGIPTAMVIFK